MENTIDADPLIWVDMEIIRKTISEYAEQGKSVAGLSQIVGFVAAVLEAHALMARASGKTHIFGGRASVSYAMQRVQDLRDLPLS